MNYANLIGWTDTHPYEIVRRISDKTIEIRAMNAVQDESVKLTFHVGGFCANCSDQNKQKWIYSSDESAQVIRCRLTKKGWQSAYGKHVLADKPIRFYDYNF